MRLVDRVELINGDERRFTVCQAISVRGSVAEEAGVQVPLGGIQLVIDKQGVTERWLVRYQDKNYEVISVIPYLKVRNPRRVVLVCNPVFGDV